MAVNPKHELCKKIVCSCVFNYKSVSWGAEIKMAKKLLELFPNNDFWWKIEFDYKPKSLNYFLTEEGKELIANKIRVFELKMPEEAPKPVVLEKKIGQDKQFTPTKTTLMEFLKE